MARRNFLAYFFLTSCLVSGQSPRYVLKGQKVTLKKDVTGQPDNILWTHDGNKVVEFNGREESVYDPYKTRVTLDWSSAELDISDLRFEDSGKYELEVFVNENLKKSYYDIEILDRVAKPTVFCKINNSNNSGTLVCSAEPRQPVHLMTFEWHSQGSVHPGPHLQISLGDEHDDKVYSCTVRNPLTTETAAFTAKDCHTTKSSSVALIAVAVVISLLLFIVGAGILYCCITRKGCFAKRQTDVENQKLYIRNGSGGTVETDEASSLIGGKSSSGKSSVGGTEQLSESANKETHRAELNNPPGVYKGHVKDKINKFNQNAKTDGDKQIADQHKGAISGPRKKKDLRRDQSSTVHQNEASSSSVTPPDADTVEDPSNTDKGDSDPEQSSKVPLGKASDPAAVGPGSRPDSEPESADKKQHQPSDDSSVDEDSNGQQLYESAEEEAQQDAGDPEPNDESTEDHKVVLSGRKSSTASDGSVSDQKRQDQQNTETSSSVTPSDAESNNNQHQPSDDSSVHKDSDGKQLEKPAEEETQQDAGDPEPNNESNEGHKVALSGRKSSTASDGSGSDKNQHQPSDDSSVDEDSDGPDHQNTEASASSVTPPDAGSDKNQRQPSDGSSVHEDLDGQQLYESAEEEKQKDAGDPEPNNESDNDHQVVLSGRKSSTASNGSDQKRPDHQNNKASASSVTPPDAGSDKNQHQPSDDSSVYQDSDGQQLYESAEEEKQQDAGDPEPNNESDNDHKVVLSGSKSSTASDGSGL
ncbi:uncharacterized protein V6R79_004192 [Siganus canaliculatus]